MVTRERAKSYNTEPTFQTPDNYRRRASHAFEVTLPAGTAVPVSNCLMGMDATGVVAPASDYSVVATFASEFIGVSESAHASSTEDQVITIYAVAEGEFDCPAGTYMSLEMLKPVLSGGAVLNDQLELATTGQEAQAIGYVTSPAPQYGAFEAADGATRVNATVRSSRALGGFIQ